MTDVAKVLVLDDEPNVVSAVQRALRRADVDVRGTTSPEEALAWIAGEAYAVAISDQRMPAMEGARFLQQVRERSPDTVRVLLTAYADTPAAIEAINRGEVYRFLTKPWDDEELRITVTQAVARFHLVVENRRLQALTASQNEALRDLNRDLERKVEERTREVTRLHQRLQQGFLEMVQALAKVTEFHSALVGSHAQRVARLTVAIAVRMGVSAADRFQIEVAATLHDIGKVCVPPGVLGVEEHALTRHEAEALRRHPLHGEAILERMTGLGEAARIVRHHHEFFAGEGYPDGLRGAAIPLGARIVATADAYDKAMNARAYYVTATPERALRLLHEQAPQRLDPAVVAALELCLAEGGQRWAQAGEVEARVKDLLPGMVLSRELRTLRGVLLLPKDSVLRPEHLAHLRDHQGPLDDVIYIYRQVPGDPPERTSGGVKP